MYFYILGELSGGSNGPSIGQINIHIYKYDYEYMYKIMFVRCEDPQDALGFECTDTNELRCCVRGLRCPQASKRRLWPPTTNKIDTIVVLKLDVVVDNI